MIGSAVLELGTGAVGAVLPAVDVFEQGGGELVHPGQDDRGGADQGDLGDDVSGAVVHGGGDGVLGAAVQGVPGDPGRPDRVVVGEELLDQGPLHRRLPPQVGDAVRFGHRGQERLAAGGL